MAAKAALKLGARTEGFELTASPAPLAPAKTVAIPELQPVRAIGCLLVFATHCTLILFPSLFANSPQRSYAQYLLRALYGFFIISGIVLTLPFVGEQQKSFSAKSFYGQRFFRLYPMYWVSLLFALTIRFATDRFVALPGITVWAERFWTLPLTPSMLFREFSGVIDIRGLVFPGYWTFACEVQICLLFPLILFTVRRTRHWAIAGAVILGMIVAIHYIGGSVFLMRTLSYFVMGAYLAKYYQPLKLWLQGLSRPVTWGCFALFLTFMAIAPVAWPTYRIALLLFDVFLALLMVMVQAFSPLAAISRLRPVQRMGDLSFCFYLVHLPVLTTCAYLLEPRLRSPILSAFAALSLSVALAWLGWRFVEMPIRAWAKAFHRDQRASEGHTVVESREATAS
ncbi:MAG TPA: acyltransferase [Terriglobales bacterium]|nr:acyltransferase [Terriglobales bacterium]